jgi:hypothetical protein
LVNLHQRIAMQPIYKQFIEPDCEFPFNRLNRNLCFGGSGGAALQTVTGGVYSKKEAEKSDPNAQKLNLDQRPNIEQGLNLDQAMTGSINTEQFGTPSTGNAPSALDTTALDKASGVLTEYVQAKGAYLTRDLPEFLKNPYAQSSYRPGEGTLGKALGTVSMESMLGIGGGDSGGSDYGASDTSTDTTAEDTAALESTSAMTDEEKQNRIRQLMASRYGRRQTILTGGTGIQGFGEV